MHSSVGELSSTAHDALARIRGKGVKLWSENGRLRYRAPRGTLTPADLTTLREHQEDFLMFLDEERRTSEPGSGEAPRVPVTEAPLSFSQQAHWYLYDLGHRRVLRQVVSAIRLRGRLSIDMLQHSLTALIHRHDALRTTIVMREGTPVQRVLPSRDCPIGLEDLSGTDEAGRESELRCLLERQAGESIDVTVDPLLAVCLIRLSAHEQVLLIAMEHLIGDASSMSIFREEWLTAYAQYVKGQALSLARLNIGFSEYAAWQHGTRTAWREHHADYWEKRLAGCARLRLPSDDAPNRAHAGWGLLPLVIGADLKLQLLQWCQMRRTTLSMAFLAAYVALVLKWCGVTEGVFQYQTDGRDLPEVEHMIGYLAAILFLRVEQHPDDGFECLLNRVTEEYCRARDHADLSSIAAQTPRPEFARNTGFNWVPQSHEDHQAILSGSPDALSCSEVSFAHPMLGQLELDHEPMIVLRDTQTEIRGELYFPFSRFSTETMARFKSGFLRLILTLVRDPNARLNNVSLD